MKLELQLIGLGLTIYVFLVFQFLYFQKKNRIELEQTLKKEWGNFSTKEWHPSDWERLTHSFTVFSHTIFIDTITWNDFEMDAIFRQINQTHSSIGEEYLYYLLHTPATEKEKLEEREHLITYFTTHEKERIAFQVLAEKIGKQKKESLYESLFGFKEIPVLKSWKHILSDIFLIGSFLFLLVNPILGIFLLILALAYSISLYYKEKAKVANSISCFQQIIPLLKAIDKRTLFQTTELKPYFDQMADAQKKLIPFKKFSLLVGQGFSGSPIDILLDYVRMLTHIDLILFNQVVIQFQMYKNEILFCMNQFGFLESMIAAASYRKALPNYCIPEFLTLEGQKKPLSIKLTNVYHPRIETPVKNSIAVKKSVLLTGSNASGKSTFLKTTAIAALLAQTIHTVPADQYQAPFYQIYSSMAIRDNLSGHDSYYMVEIKSLKRILDAKKDTIPVLCFIDEVLRGTNTVERIAASIEILKSLSNQQVLCFAATHDIELTQLLKEEYENYYFREQIQKEDILFDYQLKKGISTSRNAIRLIQQIGYEKKIVDRALLRADTFLKTGSWREI